MKKDKFLVEASFEVLATSKEQAEEILSGFIQRYINQKPYPLEIMTGEIKKNFNITESTFALDHNVEIEEEDEED
jgi:DNA-nicking Smr family endonuclease